MLLLGINDSHDASACLMRDGKVILAIQEERFQRIKGIAGFPLEAVRFIFKHQGITAADLDEVAVASTHLVPTNLFNMYASFSIDDFFELQEQYYYPRIYEGKQPKLLDVFPNFKPVGKMYYPLEKQKFQTSAEMNKDELDQIQNFRRESIAKLLEVPLAKIDFYDHHLCHAYYGLYSQQGRPDTTVVVTADGGGDGTYCTVSLFADGKLTTLERNRTNIIAKLYSTTTLIMGMRPNEHEYKIMGLAPYSAEHQKKAARKIFLDALDVDGLGFKKNPAVKDFYHYFKSRLQRFRFDGIAGGLQDFVEIRLSAWFENIYEATKCSRFIFSGGLANNVKANKAIAEKPFVDSFFVPPGPGDESISIGACYLALEKLKGKTAYISTTGFQDAYLGQDVDPQDFEKFVNSSFIREEFKRIEKADYSQVAKVLAQGEVIALINGRMEFGSRALGARSFIADPSRSDTVRKINELVKKRDFWMPFTPSILDEDYDRYVYNPKMIDSSFMTTSFDSKEDYRKQIISTLHPHDFTVRPQRVCESTNPVYYRILKAFKELTGIGVVLNTSLNIHGKPIVCQPTDLEKELLKEGSVRLNHLFICGDLFIRK